MEDVDVAWEEGFAERCDGDFEEEGGGYRYEEDDPPMEFTAEAVGDGAVDVVDVVFRAVGYGEEEVEDEPAADGYDPSDDWYDCFIMHFKETWLR